MSRFRPELIPGLLAVAVFVAWAAAGGGFAPTSWYPGTLFLLGLLVVVAIAYRRRLPQLSTPHRLALVALALYCAWTFVSIAWADVQGIAWDGANRTLLYLVVFALFSATTWRPATAAIVLGAYAIGIAGVALATMVDVTGSADSALAFIDGRLAEPTGYPNAVAALFVGGFWPAAFLAARREVPWQLRGILLAAAALLLQVALLPQSRGALLVFPLALLIFLVLAPGRLRVGFVLLAALGATALAAPAIIDVYSAIEDGRDLAAALADAWRAMAISTVGLAMLGTFAAFLDRTFSAPPRLARATGWGLGALAGLGTAVAVVLALLAIGNPVGWAGDRWDDFKGGYESTDFATSRFSGDLGSNRYDFWRVGIGELADSPVGGDGVDNFAVAYLRERDSHEEPLYPHSLAIRVLAGGGIVGALMLGVALLAAAAAAFRAQREGGFAWGLSAVGLAAYGYWFLHGLGDWLWSFPGLSAPVFAWLAIGAALGGSRGAREPGPRRLPAFLPVVLGAVVAAAAAASLAFPWAAARDVDIAASGWRGHPTAAFDRLDRAHGLNPLSTRADETAGAIASQLGDRDLVRHYFARVAERDPHSWYAQLELATVAALGGRTPEALRRLDDARRINPREPLLRRAARRIRGANPLTLRAIDRALLDKVCAKVGRTKQTQQC